MPRNLNAGAPDFDDAFAALLDSKRENDSDISDTVAGIVADVIARGDSALIDLSRQFDNIDLAATGIAISAEEISKARSACAAETLVALEKAAERIEAFHEAQMPESIAYTDAEGVSLGLRHTPVDAVGLYVPGGKAAYPSSVLMNAMPAKVAGVSRRVMVVPTPGNEINPLVLAAAEIAGITEIYRVGGAQAIAALAYGTESIRPVDKIIGPGNAYVAAAKRQVFGKVGIDSIAGPSEILVVADAENDPSWIAIDLLSQAEHDEVAQSILITNDADFAARVEMAIADHLSSLPRANIAAASWNDHGAIIMVNNLEDAIPLVDRLAPEHLELAIRDPDTMAAKIRHAGAMFLGRHTPEAVGDYIAGPNHVLPTARTARFSSGLGVLDFLKRTTCVKCDPASLAAIGPAAITLAEAEGLSAHARSIAIRLGAAAD